MTVRHVTFDGAPSHKADEMRTNLRPLTSALAALFLAFCGNRLRCRRHLELEIDDLRGRQADAQEGR